MKKLALILLLAATADAAKDEDFHGSVVYAKGTSLWKTDAKGKGPETELVTLPGDAKDVRMIRSDPAGAVVLFDLAGAWYWASTASAPATPTKLDCADAPARLSSDGACVVCADADGHAHIVSLASGKETSAKVPADGARMVDHDLVWSDADGIWRAPVKDLTQKTQLATDAPVSGFVASPDGTRGVAIYPGHVYEHKQKVDADVLATFALDGTAARRMLFRDGVVIDWSWDGVWLLLQHGDFACVTRAVGGEYKCWKGYTAMSIAPDGKWALVLGPRKGGSDDADGSNQQSLFRAQLDGAYTEHPSLVETEDDGAALWLPEKP